MENKKNNVVVNKFIADDKGNIQAAGQQAVQVEDTQKDAREGGDIPLNTNRGVGDANSNPNPHPNPNPNVASSGDTDSADVS